MLAAWTAACVQRARLSSQPPRESLAAAPACSMCVRAVFSAGDSLRGDSPTCWVQSALQQSTLGALAAGLCVQRSLIAGRCMCLSSCLSLMQEKGPPCFYFMKGECTKGSKCGYKHVSTCRGSGTQQSCVLQGVVNLSAHCYTSVSFAFTLDLF